MVSRGLCQQLGNMAVVVCLDGAQALRLAAKCLATMQVGVVIDLHEGFERDSKPLAVTEHSAMVIRQPPRTRIDVQVRIKSALLSLSAQLRVTIAAAQRPVAPAGARVVFQYLHLVAGVAQFIGGHESGNTGTQHQNRGALRGRAQADRALELGFGGKPETVHCLVHRRSTGADANHRQELPARKRRSGFFCHVLTYWRDAINRTRVPASMTVPSLSSKPLAAAPAWTASMSRTTTSKAPKPSPRPSASAVKRISPSSN